MDSNNALTLFSDLLTQCLVEVWLPYDVVVGFSKKFSKLSHASLDLLKQISAVTDNQNFNQQNFTFSAFSLKPC